MKLMHDAVAVVVASVEAEAASMAEACAAVDSVAVASMADALAVQLIR